MKPQPSHALWCTDNLLLFPISGVFIALLGVLLVVLYLVTRGLTTSLYLVEGAIPNYVPAVMLVFLGIVTALLYVKPVQPLILVAFVLCICCVILCLVQIVTTLVISLPFLGSFTACVYKPSTLECQCYIFSSKHNNSFIADDTSNHHTFRGASTCPSVQKTLKDFLYIFCIIYGFGVVACLFNSILTALLWCRHPPSTTVEINDSEGRTQLAQGDSSSGSNPATLPSTGIHHEGTSSRDHETREVSRPAARGNPPRRWRSSSVNSTQPSPSHRIARHHSFTTADTTASDRSHPERSQRSRTRPPPVLTRGGYLQSQLDGPTIPVYTLQGTNEAYISLTDLPSLQMPSLESVPAFIPELPEDVPDEEPPPYSPVENNPSRQETDTTDIIPVIFPTTEESRGLEQAEGAIGGYVNAGASLEEAEETSRSGIDKTGQHRQTTDRTSRSSPQPCRSILTHEGASLEEVDPNNAKQDEETAVIPLHSSPRATILHGENGREDTDLCTRILGEHQQSRLGGDHNEKGETVATILRKSEGNTKEDENPHSGISDVQRKPAESDDHAGENATSEDHLLRELSGHNGTDVSLFEGDEDKSALASSDRHQPVNVEARTPLEGNISSQQRTSHDVENCIKVIESAHNAQRGPPGTEKVSAKASPENRPLSPSVDQVQHHLKCEISVKQRKKNPSNDKYRTDGTKIKVERDRQKSPTKKDPTHKRKVPEVLGKPQDVNNNNNVRDGSRKRHDGMRTKQKRKVPTTPVHSGDQSGDQKKRIKEHICPVDNSKRQTVTEETKKPTQGKNAAVDHHRKAGKTKSKASDQSGRARPKTMWRPQNGHTEDNGGHLRSGSSNESLSEMIDLLESVKGRADAKTHGRGREIPKEKARTRKSPGETTAKVAVRRSSSHESGDCHDTKM